LHVGRDSGKGNWGDAGGYLAVGTVGVATDAGENTAMGPDLEPRRIIELYAPGNDFSTKIGDMLVEVSEVGTIAARFYQSLFASVNHCLFSCICHQTLTLYSFLYFPFLSLPSLTLPGDRGGPRNQVHCGIQWQVAGT
jgi:hypothetical protein